MDCTLSLLHGGSGSLIRWLHSQEVVTSYHLGPPQIGQRWMLIDAQLYLYHYCSWLGDFYSFDVSMYHVSWDFTRCCIMYWCTCIYYYIPYGMCSGWCIYLYFIISVVLVYFLMRLCICYLFMIMKLYSRLKLINKTFLNVPQREGTLQKWNLYCNCICVIIVFVYIASTLLLWCCVKFWKKIVQWTL